jgi:hypothetical protein
MKEVVALPFIWGELSVLCRNADGKREAFEGTTASSL